MDFSLKEEVTSVQQLAQQILTDFTDVDKLKQIEQQGERFDPALWAALAEAGLLGLDIDEAHGGTDLGYFSVITLCEEVGRTVAPVPVIPVLVSAAGTLRRFGTDNQKEQWLGAIARGEARVGAALEEYGDPGPCAPATQAQKDGDGYTLTGTKICVQNASTAARILVSAMAGDELVVALVDPQAAGVSLNPQVVTSGETRSELVMDKTPVAAQDVVATGAAAVEAMTWAELATRTAMAAMALGVCDKMMRITGQYTSEREQFGRPLATFQAVSHRVADCFKDVECLRLVTHQAASLLDQGRPAGDAVTMAKIWCGDVSHRVSQASQHCHGGTGVDRDYVLFRYCLWARELELSMGNTARLTSELGKSICEEYLAKSA
jgi:alkylation response protein AidB-like acyl-CoA dehydrogenase